MPGGVHLRRRIWNEDFISMDTERKLPLQKRNYKVGWSDPVPKLLFLLNITARKHKPSESERHRNEFVFQERGIRWTEDRQRKNRYTEKKDNETEVHIRDTIVCGGRSKKWLRCNKKLNKISKHRDELPWNNLQQIFVRLPYSMRPYIGSRSSLYPLHPSNLRYIQHQIFLDDGKWRVLIAE